MNTPFFGYPSPLEARKYLRPTNYGFQTHPPSGMFAPPDIKSCNLWFNGADASLQAAHGQQLRFWPDIMGLNHVFQNGANVGPSVFCNGASGQYGAIYPNGGCYPVFNLNSACVMTSLSKSYYIDQRNSSYMLIFSLNDVVSNGYIAILVNSFAYMQYNAGVLTMNATNTTFRPPSNRIICMVVTNGPGNVKVYADDVSNMQSFTALALGNSTPAGVSLGFGAIPFRGILYDVAGFNRELNLQEVDALMKYKRSTYNNETAMTATPAGRVIFDGDSITQGIGSTGNMGLPSRLGIKSSWFQHNHGVNGRTLATMITNQAVPNNWANATNWLLVQGGGNDLGGAGTGVTAEGRMNTYCTAAIAAGFLKSQIVVETVQAPGSGTEKVAFNSAMRSNYTSYAGTLMDVAGDPSLGINAGTGALNDSTYFADGTHPNDKGYTAKAAFYRANLPAGCPW